MEKKTCPEWPVETRNPGLQRCLVSGACPFLKGQYLSDVIFLRSSQVLRLPVTPAPQGLIPLPASQAPHTHMHTQAYTYTNIKM